MQETAQTVLLNRKSYGARGKMKAAVLTGERQITLREMATPRIEKDEVLVKVEYAGICGSDVHAYKSLIFPVGTILGHEFAGIVTEVGEEVKTVKPGQRVVARPPGICGQCEWCHRGEFALCSKHFENTLGLRIPGGFAEYVKMKDYQAIPLPESISFKEAAQCEPLAVCFRGAHAGEIRVGDAVIIFGAGPIGLLVLQLIRLRGARPIFVIEKSRRRREKAIELGADYVWEPFPGLLDTIQKIENAGVRLIYDCVGIEETLQQGLEVVKPGGKIVMIGATAKPVTLNQLRWLQRGITVVASMGYFVDDFAAAIRGLQKKMINVEGLVSHTLPLEEIEKGIQLLENPDQALKILIKIN
jgi:(R,R)-butanediol dehydrogenase/meso-butanediol dehydrogenase/diacetyl reductase